jgi:hypothetical protein
MSDYKEELENIQARLLWLEREVAELHQLCLQLIVKQAPVHTSEFLDRMNENFG